MVFQGHLVIVVLVTYPNGAIMALPDRDIAAHSTQLFSRNLSVAPRSRAKVS